MEELAYLDVTFCVKIKKVFTKAKRKRDVLIAGSYETSSFLLDSHQKKTGAVKRLDLNKKQDEASLDNYLRCLLLWQIILKITIGRRFFLRNKAQREFYSYCSISWNYPVQYFLQSWWLERDRRKREDLDVHKSQVDLCPTLWNWWPCKGCFLMADRDLSPGVCTSFKRCGYHFLVETNFYYFWT